MTGSDLGKVGQEQPASVPLLLLLLTVTTGLIDAVSVLGLGRVFTANMTGNVVFLGFALARVPGFSLVRSLAALAAFLAGAVIGGRLAIRLEGSRGRWLATVAAVESSLLFAAALTAIGYDGEHLAPVARLYSLIGLTAVAMGLRNATVRRLAVPDLTTTVLTLTLAGLGADSSLAGGSNPRFARRVRSVAGKLALALSPLTNHYWNTALQITPRGLATLPLTVDRRAVTVAFDFVAHQLTVECSDGRHAAVPLGPRSVAEFYRLVMEALARVDVRARIWTMPVEVPNPIRFEADTVHHAYDAPAARGLWQLLVRVKRGPG